MGREPYIQVRMHGKTPVITVSTGNEDGKTKTKRYPLTKAGCLQAGADIYATGAEGWMCSSSVDFPQEVKKGCRLDVRELMSEGFRKALEEFDRPRKALVNKIMDFCYTSSEWMKWTPKEQELFFVLREKVKMGHG